MPACTAVSPLNLGPQEAAPSGGQREPSSRCNGPSPAEALTPVVPQKDESVRPSGFSKRVSRQPGTIKRGPTCLLLLCRRHDSWEGLRLATTLQSAKLFWDTNRNGAPKSVSQNNNQLESLTAILQWTVARVGAIGCLIPERA
jgi:hypothetical protein